MVLSPSPKPLRMVRGTRAFSWAMPIKTTPSRALNFRSRLCMTSSLRIPFSNRIIGVAFRSAKSSTCRRNPSLHRFLGRSKPVALVAAEIGCHARCARQLRHIEVQIHSVDAFQLKDDIFTLEFRDVFWQSHGGVWLGICYPPSLENTSRFDGSIRHSSRNAALLLQPDTTLSQKAEGVA